MTSVREDVCKIFIMNFRIVIEMYFVDNLSLINMVLWSTTLPPFVSNKYTEEQWGSLHA